MLPAPHRHAIRAMTSCLRERLLPQRRHQESSPIPQLGQSVGMMAVLSTPAVSLTFQLSAGARATIYLTGAVLIVQVLGSWLERARITQPALMQLAFLAAGTSWTYGMLAAEGRPLSMLPSTLRATQISQGMMVGVSVFLAITAVTGSLGWLRHVKQDEQQVSQFALARSIGTLTITHAAYAWNEEIVFRGYGYDLLQAAIGPLAAGVVLTALFATYHQWTPQVLVGEAALGLALLALRLVSNDIWLPIGYHFAWNIIQTAFLGPADGPPSLFPMRVTGPYRWVGRPGYPEPGLLMAGANLLVALGVALVCWQR